MWRQAISPRRVYVPTYGDINKRYLFTECGVQKRSFCVAPALPAPVGGKDCGHGEAVAWQKLRFCTPHKGGKQIQQELLWTIRTESTLRDCLGTMPV